MAEDFKLYLIDNEFYNIRDWKEFKIPVKNNRPVLILVIEDTNYPDCFCCVPISKDDDKDDKYENLLVKSPDLVHPLSEINQYKNFLLIQNMFYLKKEFLGAPFVVDGVHSEIKKGKTRKEILKKIKKVDALMKNGKVKSVPREKGYELQVEYLEEKKKVLVDNKCLTTRKP